jgi:uncharacterized membrane protein YbhN (UPF0104 family)
MSFQESPTESDQKQSSISSRTLIIRWIGTLLALALLVYLLSREGWTDIAQALKQIGVWRFVLSIFLMLISRLAVAGRWHVLLSSVVPSITPLQSVRITFAGLFASNFLPTTIGGDVVRLGGIIQLGLDQAICVASLIVDRLVGMTGMATALPLGIPVLAQYLENSKFPAFYNSPILVTATIQSPKRVNRLMEKIKTGLEHLFSALLLWRKRPRSLTAAFAFTWIHQLSLYVQIWFLLKGLDEVLPIWTIAGLWAATYFVTLLPVSINGMGMQELSATFFLTTIGGVSLEHSLTIALLVRALQALASLPGALYIPINS